MISREDDSKLEIVNVVGSGSIGSEVDIEALATDVAAAEYDPENYHGLYLQSDEDKPLTTLYRTGKYIITGATSEDELSTTREHILRLLHDVRVLDAADDEWFTVQNYVCQADLNQEVNLNAVAIGLGLEHTEYEPEQFPGLVYRPSEYECVLLVFGSGKVIVTGTATLSQTEAAFSFFKSKLAEIM